MRGSLPQRLRPRVSQQHALICEGTRAAAREERVLDSSESDPLTLQYQDGIRLFNQHSFYECHDTIEEVWLQESSDRQPFLQGLIQAAVSFHHDQHGKWGAARAMLQRSLDKLEHYPTDYGGIDLANLTSRLQEWKNCLDSALVGERPERLSLEYPTIKTIERNEAD